MIRKNFPRSHKMSFPRAVFFASLFFTIIAFSGQDGAGASDFFSYERFELDPVSVYRMTGHGRGNRQIKDFARDFSAGLAAFSNGDYDRAKVRFLEARDAWPEYYGADFMLALVFEKEGDYVKAARFYKSYLNKLRDLYSGKYLISAALIQDISTVRPERYGEAEQMVAERLAVQGIDLDKVRPAVTLPAYLPALLISGAVIALYLVFQFILWPYVKRRERIDNPPEDFWICKSCLEANPDLSKVCQKCGKPRE